MVWELAYSIDLVILNKKCSHTFFSKSQDFRDNRGSLIHVAITPNPANTASLSLTVTTHIKLWSSEIYRWKEEFKGFPTVYNTCGFFSTRGHTRCEYVKKGDVTTEN